MDAPNVSFLGAVKYGTIARRVTIYKRALSRAGYYPWLLIFTPFAGHGFVKAVNGLQFQNRQKPNAIMGEHTHDLLVHTLRAGHPTEWAFGKKEIADWLLIDRASTVTDRIRRYWQWWDWFVGHADPIHYDQVRPQPDLAAKRKPPKLPTRADCSDTAGELIPWLAGMPPFDSIYGASGYGNTDSLVRSTRGIHISPYDFHAYARDHIILAFYGSSWTATDHVVSVKDLDPHTGGGLMYSNGSERAPERWPTLFYDQGLHFLGLIAYPVV